MKQFQKGTLNKTGSAFTMMQEVFPWFRYYKFKTHEQLNKINTLNPKGKSL